MSRRTRGFTLVELLVVITIIGMLMALIIPAVMSGVEAARRTECTSHSQQIGLALIHHDSAKDYFPGYVNRYGYNSQNGSFRVGTWVISILPYIERLDVYQLWTSPAASQGPGPVVQLRLLLCPSHPPENAAAPVNPLQYIVNSGFGLRESPYDGVCLNLNTSNSANSPNRTNISSLVDGASNTILVSENNQAGNWGVEPGGAMYTDADARRFAAFCWWDFVDQPQKRINGLKNGPPPGPAVNDLSWARPSSNHPGGVVTVFADGSVRFIADDIDYKVYKQLMTPDSARSDDQDKVLLDETNF